MTPIGHQAIAASAGSGKTFQLAHRYIRLLALGVEPDRIVALTFSRKAAGEIFESLIGYLCGAAAAPRAAAAVAAHIGTPGADTHVFTALLRRVVDALHRVHVGTLDSFIVGILRTFPFELGIGAALTLTDEQGAAAREMRQAVLDDLFARLSLDNEPAQAFLEAFKQASFGQEPKTFTDQLFQFLEDYQGYYRLLPDEDAWGSEPRVWPAAGGPPAVDRDSARTAQQAAAALGLPDMPEAQAERWRTFLEAAAAFHPGAPWPDDVEYLFDKLAAVRADLAAGAAEVKLGHRTHPVPRDACAPLLRLVNHVAGCNIRTALEQTRGLFRVLRAFEDSYARHVAGSGRLTFQDAQYLLARGPGPLSRAPGDDGRLYIDYRLDSALDHWLLDEFQDTSDLQWEVLANLADELLQDTSGRRSFFYVGDVKQSIYAWRGGNFRLFEQILDRYGSAIERRPLDVSYRSCGPVIEAVNAVFETLPEDGTLPADAVAEWRRHWRTHRWAKDAVPAAGYAVLLEPAASGSAKPTEEDRWDLAAALLDELAPHERGLSVAVLVRTNTTGKQLAGFLRARCPGVPAIHEGRAGILDSPVVNVLLSLVRLAAHPEDVFSRRHTDMSPLGEPLRRAARGGGLAAHLLRTLHAHGFEGLLAQWGAALAAQHPLDAFGRRRLEELRLCAREFDLTASRDVDAFLRHAEAYETRAAPTAGSVRVMTVHQAKGLGFDVVLLPDLQARSLTHGRRADMLVARSAADRRPDWVLRAPRARAAALDPVLARERAAALAADTFEELCALYVSLTRARQGLYLITSHPGDASTSFTPAALLKQQFRGAGSAAGAPGDIAGRAAVCLQSWGDANWYRARAPAAATPRPALAALPAQFAQQPSRRRRLARVEPSSHRTEPTPAARLFSAAGRAAAEFGTAMHELFEHVAWTGDAEADALCRAWAAVRGCRADIAARVETEFRRALAAPAFRAALARPGPHARLWREKHFDIVLDDAWVTGIFDRVAIACDAAGRPLAATVQDFKTDDVAEDADIERACARYAPQLGLYGRAVARMLALPPERVTLQLLFTRPCAVRTLAPPVPPA